MPPVRVVTDSIADIPPSLAQSLGITQVPCLVRFGDLEFRDRIDLMPDEFYRRLESSRDLPKTSQPSAGVFEEIYARLVKTTDQILAIHAVASLSGIFNASRLAAERITNARIELLDSQQVTMALGWLVIVAARAAQQGCSLDEVKAVVHAAMPRVHLIAVLDTLEYAYRGGRLGKGAALLGTLLNVKPFLSVVKGEVVPVEKVRSQKRALERIVEIAIGSGPIEEIAVIHAAAKEKALQVKRSLADWIPEERIILTETGPVLGAHVGPGAVGIAWLNNLS